MKTLYEITRIKHFDETTKSQIENLASTLALDGQIRQSIECLRFLLDKETDGFKRSVYYVALAKNYRVLLQMKNARYEVNRAFLSLGLTPPRNTLWSLLRSFMWRFGFGARRLKSAWEHHLNDLFVELGLCGYYLREDLTMAQASLQSRYFAFRAKDPWMMMNWYGGTACVYRLMGWTKASKSYIDDMHRIATHHPGPIMGKGLLWTGLYYEYNNEILASSQTFQRILDDESDNLSIFDVRLVATTLSCQYMIRGYFQKSLDIFSSTAFRPCLLQGYSGQANSIDWYRIVALRAIGQDIEAQRIISDHKYVLSSSDEELWTVTLFIGQCFLAESMGNPNKDTVFTLIERFKDLNLKPRQFFIEAAYFWVGKCRCLYKLYLNERTPELAKLFEQSLQQLNEASSLDYIRAHEYVLRAFWAKLHTKSDHTELIEKATGLAQKTENIWVLDQIAKGEI